MTTEEAPLSSIEKRLASLEQKYDGIREDSFQAKSSYRIANAKDPGFAGVIISFDLQLLIKPCDDNEDPGYLTIKSVQLRRGPDGGLYLGLPGKKTSTGNWFTFVTLHSSTEESIKEEAMRLVQGVRS